MIAKSEQHKLQAKIFTVISRQTAAVSSQRSMLVKHVRGLQRSASLCTIEKLFALGALCLLVVPIGIVVVEHGRCEF